MAVEDTRKEFAALVDAARRGRYLSIRAAARIAEVPATTAAGWLKGKHLPTPALRDNYLRLLEHLELAGSVPESFWGSPDDRDDEE